MAASDANVLPVVVFPTHGTQRIIFQAVMAGCCALPVAHSALQALSAAAEDAVSQALRSRAVGSRTGTVRCGGFFLHIHSAHGLSMAIVLVALPQPWELDVLEARGRDARVCAV
jgi:hypothetical protein